MAGADQLMFGGALMLGAKDRLLPPNVPFRFFGAAVLFHLAAWVLLLIDADEVPGFHGGPGLGLAILHLVTLGVLAMTAIGAGFQLLPVATRHQLGPVWACRLAWWLLTPGVVVLCLGFTTGLVPLLHGGAGLTVAGLIVSAVLMARTLVSVTDLPGVTRHAWIALVSLVGLAGLGMALVIDFSTGWLPDHANFAAAHAALAGYGFMGNLALGFSTVLVPMFVLGPAVPAVEGRRTALLAAVALGLGISGLMSGLGWLTAVGGLIGLIATAVHLRAMLAVMKLRMKKRLEPFFRVAAPGWAMMPISLMVGMALALGAPSDRLVPLWGFLMIFGWLLTFVTGILQRIMPFLASMHSGTRGGKPALLSQLIARRPLDIHAVLHGAALVLIAGGIVGVSPLLVRLGAACGAAGAIAFLVFALELARRARAHERTQVSPSPH